MQIMASFTDKFKMTLSKMSPTQLAEYYSSWAENMGYEKDMNECKFRASSIVADEMAACFPEKRDQLHIMDIACGTGRVGTALAAYGFTNIDGLDSSSGMLNVCMKTGHYHNLYEEYCGYNTLPIQDDVYDCLGVAGGIGGGHIPCSGIMEMIRIVKPGGLIIIAMRKEFEERVGKDIEDMDALISTVENKNKAELVERREVDKYFVDRDGILFKIRVK
ncbi:uncharacterized protein LOC132752000 [Ruditapes philippinarum]|uniref:uncharacterized protein LOC132752000 n=1 Tax=Ruditapes philippinarum TaxID=129788 RepID=UPI00295C1996|nr:uncharacterized protein LOC132752000 [Ruditapes philippinarum]